MHASASMFRPLATSRRWALATALGSAALLGGCVVAPVPGPVYAEPAGYPVNAGVYAPIAPPQPYYEVQPAMPFPGAVWISGYWGYNGGRHQWTRVTTNARAPATAGSRAAGTIHRTAAGTCAAAAGCAERRRPGGAGWPGCARPRQA